MSQGQPQLRDPATFEVFKNAIVGLANEMAITVIRTAHSQIMAESMDFSTALCDARGRVVAQGNCTPLHLGAVDKRTDRRIGRFEFGREAHHVHQRRAKVVADNIGELLDFIVRSLQLGRAPLDRPFEIGVQQVQPVPGPGQVDRVAPHEPEGGHPK